MVGIWFHTEDTYLYYGFNKKYTNGERLGCFIALLVMDARHFYIHIAIKPVNNLKGEVIYAHFTNDIEAQRSEVIWPRSCSC